MLLYIKEPAHERGGSPRLAHSSDRGGSWLRLSHVHDGAGAWCARGRRPGAPLDRAVPCGCAYEGGAIRATCSHDLVRRARRRARRAPAAARRGDVRLVTLTGPAASARRVSPSRLLAGSLRDLPTVRHTFRSTGSQTLICACRRSPKLSASSSLGPDQELGLARRVRDLQLLLVLDNFEHLLAAAPLVTRLLETGSGLEVLATSREPLRFAGGPRVRRSPHSRVRRRSSWSALPPFVRTSSGTTGTSARRTRSSALGRLPLAVELVAAAARILPPRALLEHLVSSLDAPASGRRDAPARQQTVRATIDWSYESSADHERDVFEFSACSAIRSRSKPHGRSWAATRWPCCSLSALVDKSLLVHAASESEDSVSHDPGRLRVRGRTSRESTRR